ncbi:unnamed protein product, partial [marine sediment metagenome]
GFIQDMMKLDIKVKVIISVPEEKEADSGDVE